LITVEDVPDAVPLSLDPLGGTVGTSPRAFGGGASAAPGVVGMWDLTSIAVVFLVVSAGVIALARSTTARWERESRAARVPRSTAVEPAPPPDVAARVGRALAGAVAAARPVAAPIRGLARAIGQTLGAFRQSVARGARDVPQVWDALRHVHVGRRRPSGSQVVRRPRRAAAHLPRRRRKAGTTGREPVPAFPRLTSRLAARAVQRRARRRTPQVPGEQQEGS
jgi:hypothetical protein